MKLREISIIAILIVFFLAFTILTNTSYTGYLTQEQCDLITYCENYTKEGDCTADECDVEADCLWDLTACLSCDAITDCSDYTYENLCQTDPCFFNCEWDTPDCFEFIEEDTSQDIPQSTLTLSDTIETIQSLSTNLETLEILESMSIDFPSTISALNDYDLQLQTIEQDTTLAEVEKQEAIINIEMQVDDLIANIPKLVKITNQISGLPSTPVGDITPNMLLEKVDESMIDQIYSIQDDLEARTDLKIFTLLTFAGEEFSGTYITKTVNAPVQNGYVLEIIPSTITASEEDLMFFGDYEIMGYEPLMLSIPIINQMVVFSYILAQDISALIDQIQTAVIPYEVETVATGPQATCGDGVCHTIILDGKEFALEDERTCPEDCAKKIPWLLILIIIIILIAIVLFIHFFRGKLSGINIKKLVKKEKVFAKKIDKINLKNYIKNSLKEGIEEPKIKTILLAKGWTEKQFNLIINEIKQETKSKEPVPSKEQTSKKELKL